MKNLKNYLFVAAATLFGIVGCNTLKQEVTTTHNITTNNTPGTTTKITTQTIPHTSRKTPRGFHTETLIESKSDSCLGIKFGYDKGESLNYDTTINYIERYGYWAGRMRKIVDDSTDGSLTPASFDSIHGILGWTIPFGDIKELIELYNQSTNKPDTGNIGFTAYIGFSQIPSTPSDRSVAHNIDAGMTNAHLMLVLTVNGVEQPKFGFRDLIQPCPNTCDHNTALANKYKTEYKDGYNKQ